MVFFSKKMHLVLSVLIVILRLEKENWMKRVDRLPQVMRTVFLVLVVVAFLALVEGCSSSMPLAADGVHNPSTSMAA